MRDPGVVKQFTEQQLSIMVLERDRFADLIRKDTEKWGKVVKSAGIKME
jgi:tripartite-type tricarboxylate transporter receptor subunit TctC